jgi:hypothetical protein
MTAINQLKYGRSPAQRNGNLIPFDAGLAPGEFCESALVVVGEI